MAVVDVDYYKLNAARRPIGGIRSKTLTLADSAVNAEEVARKIGEADSSDKSQLREWAQSALKNLFISGGDITVEFESCTRLEVVDIQAKSCRLPDNAFRSCKSLKSITLPMDAEFISIWHYAFFGCDSLRRFVYPLGVRECAGNAFYCLRSLTRIADVNVRKPESLTIAYDNFGVRCERVPLREESARVLALARAIDPASQEEVRELIDSSPSKYQAYTDVVDTADFDSVRKYLGLAAKAESQLFQISEELSVGLSRDKLLSVALKRRRIFDSMDRDRSERLRKREVDEERREWQEERNAISEGLRLSFAAKRAIGERPTAPSSSPDPVKPEPPKLGKPGFFNRRKVEQRNAELEREYQEALATYNAELAERQSQIEQYERDTAAWEQRRAKEIQSQLDSYGLFMTSIPRVPSNDSRIALMLAAAYEANTAFCSELKTRLVECASLLKAIYSADVVFPKYRNISAVTTIYEYLESGRCTTLQGPDGAYNLYESELRQNAIIGKLDDISGKLDSISDQLDQIQRNQYLLYTAIQETNKRIDGMSATLNDVLDMACKTNDAVNDISSKASAIVANTASIAYWAKKNAELTDSLGYLVAFTA